jgi:LPXTG-motif cell wall-anchored protein
MKRMVSASIAALGAIALAVVPVTAANAVAWDGNNIVVGAGKYEPKYDKFGIGDTFVWDTANSAWVENDIWDGAGELLISVDDWVDSETVQANAEADLDVTEEVASGDILVTATMSGSFLTDNELAVVGEMRFYAESNLVRNVYRITNTGASAATVDFGFYTDWGSRGQIWSYQGQSDDILAVPALEDAASTTALADAGARWAVHNEGVEDAPGAMAWGNATGEVPSTIFEIDNDDWTVHIDDVTLAAGETIALAVFHNWTPELITSVGFTYDAGADAVTTLSAEFDSFSGRLTRGLEEDNVLNWGPVAAPVTPEAPALAATGTNGAALASAVAFGSFLLIAGGAVVLRRRRATN